MSNAPPTVDPHTRLRRGLYVVLGAVAIGGMLGRILAVNSVDRVELERHLHSHGKPEAVIQRPFLSGNDRSRWATIRSLVEHGTYQIDAIVAEPTWDTIDMVKHDDEGQPAPAVGQGHLYSSKPPLLATILAGEYWVIHKLTGQTLGEHPYAIGRFMLVTFNVLPMIVYFVMLAKLAERFGTTDWGRLFVFAAGAFGTFLSTFVIVLNNHLPGAVSASIALYCTLRIIYDGERHWGYFVLAGLFGAFTVACELPALALFGLLSLWLLWRAPKPTLFVYVPAALVVVTAYFGTNWIAHHSLRVPYDHRSDGDNWYTFQFQRGDKVVDSYWSKMENRNPIDQGEPEIGTYALHVFVGHHGIFSLTPVWLLSVVGGVMLCVARGSPWRTAGLLVLVVTVVCLAFYIAGVSDENRNYGGMTSGFRWVFWMAPLWLLAMLPVADWIAGRRWLELVAATLLGLSVMSAAYPIWNPWTHPWILNGLLEIDAVGLGTRPAGP